MESRIWFPQVATALGSCYSAMGRLTDALPLLEEAVGVGGAMRLLGAGTGPDGPRRAHLLEGKLAQSSETAQSALLVAQQNGRRGHEAWALRLLGELALCRPDAPLAGTTFTQALALTTALDMRPLSAHCYFRTRPRPSDGERPPSRRTAPGDGGRSIP